MSITCVISEALPDKMGIRFRDLQLSHSSLTFTRHTQGSSCHAGAG